MSHHRHKVTYQDQVSDFPSTFLTPAPAIPTLHDLAVLLQTAIDARIASWDATRAIELAFAQHELPDLDELIASQAVTDSTSLERCEALVLEYICPDATSPEGGAK